MLIFLTKHFSTIIFQPQAYKQGKKKKVHPKHKITRHLGFLAKDDLGYGQNTIFVEKN